MAQVVADTSALVSLGIAADLDVDPLAIALDKYTVLVPTVVVDELEEVASYDDDHGRAAGRVLDRMEAFSTRSVELDAEFPLDDGENAAVTLANEEDADLLLCDEFNRLGLIHASLVDTRLVTSPTLLSVFVRNGWTSSTEAQTVLDAISSARSWDANSYVQRARSLLE
ncbi:PIN domain-containing protein [Halobaculum gomorrense]|uniref:Predicted nucleic acid-binding protein, contains PIN domain n=1 Tax=Halobaculum gomorrense TaxID=43928 RepID=A0A1M5UTY9_9EURY|nr:hypothetical protein [Halobaculum gomorrense]SHH66193.1 Predicted nucleic acid-binding protein, contains PIN domain [Halobaculum gomorrense]